MSKMDSIIGFSELEDYIDTPMRTYSSGMYVRLGFSIATTLNPDILLIDEVLAVGDEHFQNKCIDRISSMKKNGTTILLVTHSMGLVKNMCGRALWVKNGTIETDDEPVKTVESYLAYIKTLEPSPLLSNPRYIRTGSRQAVIEKVSFLNAENKATGLFRTGDSLKVHIEYYAKEKLVKPTFGMSVFTGFGDLVYGFASKGDGTSPDCIKGKGIVKISFEDIPLLKGEYLVSIGILDEDSVKAYDFHEKLYSIKVEQGNTDEGLVFMKHSYEFGQIGKEEVEV